MCFMLAAWRCRAGQCRKLATSERLRRKTCRHPQGCESDPSGSSTSSCSLSGAQCGAHVAACSGMARSVNYPKSRKKARAATAS